MRFVGLTGGVASGKSAASRAFEALGIPVVDADIAARAVVAPGSEGLSAVIGRFGPQMLTPAGELDRGALRAHVFAHSEERRALEGLLHPRIRDWLSTQAHQASGPYVVVAIPLLTEGGGQATYPWLERILVVDVPEALQLSRLQARDGSDATQARQMLAAQATRAARLALAHDILVNTGSLKDLESAVARLDHRYRSLASGA